MFQKTGTSRIPIHRNRGFANDHFPRSGLSGEVADPGDNADRFPSDVGKSLEVLQPNGRRGAQLDPSNDAVPRLAQGIGDGVGVGHVALVAIRVADDHPVVEADRQSMVSGINHPESELMRSGQAPGGAGFAIIEPHARFPAGAFEEELNPPTFPVRRNLEVALIPRRTQVVPFRLGKEGDFDRAGLRELIAQFRGLQFPPLAAQAQDSGGVRGDLIAVTLRLEDARERDPVFEVFPLPVRGDARVVAIHREAP